MPLATADCKFQKEAPHTWVCLTHNRTTFGLDEVLTPLYCRTKWEQIKRAMIGDVAPPSPPILEPQ